MKKVVIVLAVLNVMCLIAGLYCHWNPVGSEKTAAVSSENVHQVHSVLPQTVSIASEPAVQNKVSQVSESELKPTSLPEVIASDAAATVSQVKETATVEQPVLSIPPEPVKSGTQKDKEKETSVQKPVENKALVQQTASSKQQSVSLESRIACIEFGPFSEKANIDIKRLLGTLPSDVTIRQKQRTVSSGSFLVYMIAPAQNAERMALMAALEEKRIDFFLTKLAGSTQEIFSLGVFNEPARAEKFQKTLKTQGFSVHLEQKQTIETWIRVLNAPEILTSRYSSIRTQYPNVKMNKRCSPWS